MTTTTTTSVKPTEEWTPLQHQPMHQTRYQDGPGRIHQFFPVDDSEIFKKIRSCIVKLRGAKEDGSGVFGIVDGKLKLFTTQHGLDNPENIQIQLGENQYKIGSIEKENPFDLASIECLSESRTWAPAFEVMPSKELEVGDKVYYVAFPANSHNLMFHTGHISRIQEVAKEKFKAIEYTIQGPFLPGYSGGAVFGWMSQGDHRSITTFGKRQLRLVGIIESKGLLELGEIKRLEASDVKQIANLATILRHNASLGLGTAIGLHITPISEKEIQSIPLDTFMDKDLVTGGRSACHVDYHFAENLFKGIEWRPKNDKGKGPRGLSVWIDGIKGSKRTYRFDRNPHTDGALKGSYIGSEKDLYDAALKAYAERQVELQEDSEWEDFPFEFAGEEMNACRIE